VLRYGSLPVQLEQQTVRTVSATLGKDSLRAGLIAGLIGAGIVFLYMIVYYRILGLVVIAGMAIWFSLNWSIISYLGSHSGLALSLSGVTGIVVSIGVTVDSYVVYFERIKDEIHLGRTMRSAVDTAFRHSFRTVLVADTSAFLAALILYVLTVGPVRGFAFFLGLSTILDVVVAYFFKRPLVLLLGRLGWLQRSKFVGIRGRAAVEASTRPGLEGAR
jgi:preprotein translocase subunit SecD